MLRKSIASIAFGISTLYIVSIDVTRLFFTAASQDEMAAATTSVFLKVVAVLFVLGLLQLVARWALISEFAAAIPAHLSAIGVLGTFVGIFVGLYKFNVDDLQASVPFLLDGMKLAFSTSIAGLGASTALKVSHSLVVSISESEDPWALGSESALEAMEGIDHTLFLSDRNFETLIERLEKTRKAAGASLDVDQLLDSKSLTHRLTRLTPVGFEKFVERLKRIRSAAS